MANKGDRPVLSATLYTVLCLTITSFSLCSTGDALENGEHRITDKTSEKIDATVTVDCFHEVNEGM